MPLDNRLLSHTDLFCGTYKENSRPRTLYVSELGLNSS